jgi:hypothetical protein
VTAPQGKSYEAKLAAVIRLMGSPVREEALSAFDALGRLLASRGVTFTEFGDGIEKLATGGLEEAEMKRLYDAGYAKGLEDATRRQFEAESVYGLRADGSHDWQAIALFCQRENGGLKANEKQFVDDMAGRLSWSGREPTPKQGDWLLAIFRKLGGRLTK